MTVRIGIPGNEGRDAPQTECQQTGMPAGYGTTAS